MTVSYPDGVEEIVRLQDYDHIFAIPGLYEEVVQRRLKCASPSRIAQELLQGVTSVDMKASELHVLDVGAGNGLSGQELRRIGVGTVIGLDVSEIARLAAERDRPGVYEEYIVADMATPDLIPDLIQRYKLNTVTCAGALGHLPVDDFARRVWSEFPKGSWISAGVFDVPGTENKIIASYKTTGLFEIISCERFRHRQTMAGEPIYNLALLARRS